MRKIPGRFKRFMETDPDVGKAYDALGKAAQAAGPLSERTRELVKLGIAIGNRHEGAVHSHTRRCLDAGATAEEVRHAAILSVTTLGFPNMMAALSWVEEVLNDQAEGR